ncbi:MAG TPA: hypothetical protein VIN09_00660 [Chloroflexota bacterium]
MERKRTRDEPPRERPKEPRREKPRRRGRREPKLTGRAGHPIRPLPNPESDITD